MPYKAVKERRRVSRQHYQRHKSDYKNHRRTYTERNRQFVNNYLRSHPCIICGEQDIVVLEFDHRDQAEKECNIAQAITNRCFGLTRLQAEIEKCDVLCANCHRRKTAKQLGYNKIS